MEELYKLIVETANEGVWIKNSDHITTYVNKKMASILGYEPDEIIGKAFFEFVYPEDIEFVKGKHQDRIEGESGRYELRFKSKTGECVWTRINASPLFNDQGYIGSLGMISDISARKEREQQIKLNERRYQSLFENSPVPIWEEDFSEVKLYIDRLKASGVSNIREYFLNNLRAVEECSALMKVIDINTAVVELNKAPSKEYMFEHFRDLIDENSTEYAIRQFEAIANGDRSCEFDAELTTFTKEKVHIHFKWTVVSGFEDNYKKIYLTTTDVTDRILAENKRLKASNFQKEILLKEIHHRVKNNLQIIISLLRLQSSSIDDQKTIDLFEMSLHRINAMALVHELLYQSKDFAQINYSLYLDRLINSLVESMSSPESDVEVEINTQGIRLNINTSIILSLLINEIITNSAKYAFDGRTKGKIYININHIEDNKYLLEVGDDGIGYEIKSDIESIESLGLQLIHSLTEQLNGIINQTSSSNGTHYSISFEELKDSEND